MGMPFSSCSLFSVIIKNGLITHLRMKYYLYWNETFWGAHSKTIRAYAQGKQYHTIVESRVHLTISSL